MSLRAFADRCALAGRQIEPSQLSRIERELCVPRPKLLAAMAKVLGVEPSALLRQDSEGTK
jgi:transcriptional regulator with XRE-family HTH domain